MSLIGPRLCPGPTSSQDGSRKKFLKRLFESQLLPLTRRKTTGPARTHTPQTCTELINRASSSSISILLFLPAGTSSRQDGGVSLSVNSRKSIHKTPEVIIGGYFPSLLSLQEKDVFKSEESAQGRGRWCRWKL